MLTQAELKLNLHYDPDTGVFTRLKTNKKIVRKDRYGYLNISFKGKDYTGHKIAWVYFYGELPISDIDHINLNRDDNRIENLRLATKSENEHNKKKLCTNKSGFKGVSRYKNKWRAQARLNGLNIHLGYFSDLMQAAKCYSEFVLKNHGEFVHHSITQSLIE